MSQRVTPSLTRPTDGHAEEPATGAKGGTKYLLGLSLTALGVVYGDIGTSPLYAIRECFHGPHAMAVTPENILGVLSLIFWSLILVISLKYLAYVMRANHDGEGGILALMAQACLGEEGTRRAPFLLLLVGVFGAALLYGDGVITPAISVLSAVEGIGVFQPELHTLVVPITIAILIALFFFQRRGTAGVGRVFGPVTLIWFLTLATLGIGQIAGHPEVLAAVSPHYAALFFAHHGLAGAVVLGAIFLVVTGGEALYADMGHFGVRPIRLTWFVLVLPALVLNYFGQGALLLGSPEAASQPFYRMAPSWFLVPLIAIGTAATVIASQAVISGAFSLTRQAVMLGYLPRMRILHTSAEEIGQIYVPSVNWLLMLTTIAVVFAFGSSASLASAYGIAVSATMVITTVLAYRVARRRWGWSLPAVLSLTAALLAIDLAFFSANVVRVVDGGWFPLGLAGGITLMMLVWRRGRRVLSQRYRELLHPWEEFQPRIPSLQRVEGTAVYMTTDPSATPPALLHNLKHNSVLHETVLLLTVAFDERPRISQEERSHVEALGEGCYRVHLRCGYLESPDVPSELARAVAAGLLPSLGECSYVLGRETLVPHASRSMPGWQVKVFSYLTRNAQRPTTFFRLPPDRVLEIGIQLGL